MILHFKTDDGKQTKWTICTDERSKNKNDFTLLWYYYYDDDNLSNLVFCWSVCCEERHKWNVYFFFSCWFVSEKKCDNIEYRCCTWDMCVHCVCNIFFSRIGCICFCPLLLSFTSLSLLLSYEIYSILSKTERPTKISKTLLRKQNE